MSTKHSTGDDLLLPFFPAGVYRIRNTVNGKEYIGSSVDVQKRWSAHRSALRLGTHPNRHLQTAWNKYGEEAFVFEMVTACESAESLEREQAALDRLFASKSPEQIYNKATCAEAPTRGLKHSEAWYRKMRGRKPSEEERRKLREAAKRRPPVSAETRRKLSEAKRGKKLSQEHRRKLSEAHRGKKPSEQTRIALRNRRHSEETRRKIGQAHRGMKRSTETRRKQSEAAKRRRIDPETRRKISETLKRRHAQSQAEKAAES